MIRYRGGRDGDGIAVVTWVMVEDHREVSAPELLPATAVPFDWGEGDASALVEALLGHAVGAALVCETCGGTQMLSDVNAAVPCYTCSGQGVTDAQLQVLDQLRQLLTNRLWAMPRLEPWTISDLELLDLVQVLLPVAPPPDVVPEEEAGELDHGSG
jgi:hypothetical protein